MLRSLIPLTVSFQVSPAGVIVATFQRHPPGGSAARLMLFVFRRRLLVGGFTTAAVGVVDLDHLLAWRLVAGMLAGRHRPGGCRVVLVCHATKVRPAKPKAPASRFRYRMGGLHRGAVWAAGLGALSLGLGLLGPLAIRSGLRSRRAIVESGGRLHGEALALFGLVAGLLSTAFLVAGLGASLLAALR